MTLISSSFKESQLPMFTSWITKFSSLPSEIENMDVGLTDLNKVSFLKRKAQLFPQKSINHNTLIENFPLTYFFFLNLQPAK